MRYKERGGIVTCDGGVGVVIVEIGMSIDACKNKEMSIFFLQN